MHTNARPPCPDRPAMSTCPESNVRILPQVHIAPVAAGTYRKSPTLPPAAPPTRNGMKPAMPPMPAPPATGPVSCHEKHAAVTVLRTFCTRTTYFARFYDKNGRQTTATVSCYESPCLYPVTRRKKNFSKLGQSDQNKHFDTLSIPCRYPISAVSQPLYDTHGRSWAYSGQSRPHFCTHARRYRQAYCRHH